MTEETVLIIGLGEVGRSLYDLFSENSSFEVHGYDVNEEMAKKLTGRNELRRDVDVMHICIPCKKEETFVQMAVDYIRKVKPKLTIIDSTIPPGTTQKIYEITKAAIADSPIRGMHKNVETMKNDIRFWTKYVGGSTLQSATEAKKHFEKLGLKVKVLKSPAETELAKLFETTYRAWMIACFQEMHRISRHFNADFEQVIDMLEEIHRVDLNKPLHYPDVIGGHCLIPNTELLLSVYDSEFLRLILKSNEKRKKEIKDVGIREDVERVRMKTLTLDEELGKEHRRP
jgi:UDP-N-acetyl-D-mannosaminuronate dehydrogenase